ncbi:cupredoxin domain-containing protein [Streptomyces sp. NPDC001407]|uniref:cupredoxin domain-containing protein n=1 Tax=unclassified Streptomyces TaxID=2593676 RepID=UPI00369C69C3
MPDVSMANHAFAPAELPVLAGETVTWTNDEDGEPHTVTSDTGLWDSGVIEAGASFSRMFSAPGMFRYHCGIHPEMTGAILVT